MFVFQSMILRHALNALEAAEERLSDAASSSIEAAFWNAAFQIAQETADDLCADIAAKTNPLAAFDSRLITKQQKEDAAAELLRRLKSGDAAFPDALYGLVEDRLTLLENALTEMFQNLRAHKRDICRELFRGAEYSKFSALEIGEGDFHDMARSTVILHTDCGKMVYKPRPSRLEKAAREFVRRYFSDTILIPRCFANGTDFGVSEYVEKEVPRGEAAAKKWYRSMGELTALCGLLNSSDMHCENVFSSEGIPSIVDLETLLTPERWGTEAYGFPQAVVASVWKSALMPRKSNDTEYSVLLNTGPLGCAPLVDGEPVTVLDCEEEYMDGFRNGYERILSRKTSMERDLRELFSQVQIRVILRDSQYYGDLLKGSYRRKYMSANDPQTMQRAELDTALGKFLVRKDTQLACHAEADALLRGDIPRFYTFGNSTDLYADGRVIVKDFMCQSAVDAALGHLRCMGEQTLAQETALVRRLLHCAVIKAGNASSRVAIPQRASQAISPNQALAETEQILQSVFENMLTLADSQAEPQSGWIDPDLSAGGTEILSPELFTGSCGIGVFAAAVVAVTTNDGIRGKARLCEEVAVEQIDEWLSHMDQQGFRDPDLFWRLPGLLRGLILMQRYHSDHRYDREVAHLLRLLDVTAVPEPVSIDQISGLAGLISILCAYEELYEADGGKERVERYFGAVMT